jgi:hypothetical protein
MFTKPVAIALACSAAMGFTSANADAAIQHYAYAAHHYSRCDDMGFARVGDGWVADPVCQAELAAHVAHERGEHYTASELYNNPATMDEFCRGETDINLTTACAPYND